MTEPFRVPVEFLRVGDIRQSGKSTVTRDVVLVADLLALCRAECLRLATVTAGTCSDKRGNDIFHAMLEAIELRFPEAAPEQARCEYCGESFAGEAALSFHSCPHPTPQPSAEPMKCANCGRPPHHFLPCHVAPSAEPCEHEWALRGDTRRCAKCGLSLTTGSTTGGFVTPSAEPETNAAGIDIKKFRMSEKGWTCRVCRDEVVSPAHPMFHVCATPSAGERVYNGDALRQYRESPNGILETRLAVEDDRGQWKAVDWNGGMQKAVNFRAAAAALEGVCGAANPHRGEPGITCTKPYNHAGSHRDAVSGSQWFPTPTEGERKHGPFCVPTDCLCPTPSAGEEDPIEGAVMDAVRKAYRETTGYWAPELRGGSLEHAETLADNLGFAARQAWEAYKPVGVSAGETKETVPCRNCRGTGCSGLELMGEPDEPCGSCKGTGTQPKGFYRDDPIPAASSTCPICHTDSPHIGHAPVFAVGARPEEGRKPGLMGAWLDQNTRHPSQLWRTVEQLVDLKVAESRITPAERDFLRALAHIYVSGYLPRGVDSVENAATAAKNLLKDSE